MEDIQEYKRLYTEANAAIGPYMIIVGRDSKSVSTQADRSALEHGIALMLRAIDIIPGSWPAWWIIGKACQALEDNDRACEAFRRAYTISSENVDVCREYSYECMKLGRSAEAIAAAETAVHRSPGNAGLLANLALALVIGGELSRAKQTCNDALSANPDDKITKNLARLINEIESGARPRLTRLP